MSYDQQHFHLSSSTESHRAEAPESVGFAVLTVSDTRTTDNDSSGRLMREHLGFRGHNQRGYAIVPDEKSAILDQLEAWIGDDTVDAILINGGTGIAGRDVTYPAIQGLIEKPIPGFGELFRMLSWQEVGAASMLSRATAGVAANGTLIFSTPGSSNAVRLAMEKLIGPELAHIVHETRKQRS